MIDYIVTLKQYERQGVHVERTAKKSAKMMNCEEILRR